MQRPLLILTLSLLSLPAAAQVEFQVSLPIPTIRFEAPPPVVVVEPGVQVVPDSDEEIFFAHRAYWVRRGDVWYRSYDHRGHWVAVPMRVVPVAVARIPPGRYRHFHGDRDDRRWHHGEHEGWHHDEGWHGDEHGHGHHHHD